LQVSSFKFEVNYLLILKSKFQIVVYTKQAICFVVVLISIIKRKRMSKTILMTASVLLAMAVAIGAFGAHGLKSHLSTEMLATYKTGVEYHFYHALGLLLVGVLAYFMPSVQLKWSAIFLFSGIILFSGSLYVLAITGIKWLGAITPLGGLSFIAGWILLFVAVWKKV